MTPMRIRALLRSPDNERTVIVLEDVERRLQFTFSADLHEAHRLGKALGSTQCTCNPIYDFIESLMCAVRTTITRVVLDDAGGFGIRAVVWLNCAEARLPISCYPPDALGLALRAKVPIYATAEALAHAKPLTTIDDAAPAGSVEVSRWLQHVSPDDFCSRQDGRVKTVSMLDNPRRERTDDGGAA